MRGKEGGGKIDFFRSNFISSSQSNPGSNYIPGSGYNYQDPGSNYISHLLYTNFISPTWKRGDGCLWWLCLPFPRIAQQNLQGISIHLGENGKNWIGLGSGMPEGSTLIPNGPVEITFPVTSTPWRREPKESCNKVISLESHFNNLSLFPTSD